MCVCVMDADENWESGQMGHEKPIAFTEIALINFTFNDLVFLIAPVECSASVKNHNSVFTHIISNTQTFKSAF